MELGSSLYLDTISAAVKSLVATIAQLPAATGVEDGIPPDGVVPADILRALARLRLLEGVPFSYLVPDADLTPPETSRERSTNPVIGPATPIGRPWASTLGASESFIRTRRSASSTSSRTIG